MATELGKAFVQIVPSARGIQGSITNLLGGEADNAGSKAGHNIAGKIKGVIAAAGIGTALWKTLEAGGNLEQSYIGGLDTLFGEAADQARSYANEAYKYGVSMNSYAEQSVSFAAALKQSFGDAEDAETQAMEAANLAIQDMADNAAKMGTPLESIQTAYQGFAKQNYTMLDNLKLGYGGTKSEMERLLATASAMPEAMGKTFDIDNLADVYEAIHLIQEDLKLTGSAAEEAGKTFQGSLNSMKAAGENFMGALMLGQDVGPALTNLVTSAETFLFDNLLPAVGRIVAALPEVIGTGVTQIVPTLLEKGAELITGLTDGINQNAPQLAAAIPEAVNNAIESITTNGPGLIAKAGELISNLANAIISNAPLLWNAAVEAVTTFGTYLQENGPQLAAKAGDLIGNLVEGFISNLPEIASGAGEVILTLLQGLGSGVGLLLEMGLELVGGIVEGIWDGISSLITPAMESAKEALTGPIETAKELINTAIEKIKGFFSFNITWPHIPLPHFSISGSVNPLTWLTDGVPKISIDWYAKAGENPYMFSDATLFGAGEKGDEILYGRAALMNDIREATNGAGRAITINVTVNGSDNPEEWANRLTQKLKMNMRTI